MLADCHSYSEVRRKIACTDRYISGWKLRFQLERLAGLDSRYRGAEYRRRTAQTEARILELTRCGLNDGSTHWSSYRLAKELGTSQSTISRIWRQFGLQPHRSRSYMTSDDPEFEEKAADIIGLYLKPPVHAAVFCVDEKSATQALDRLDPVLPLSPGREIWFSKIQRDVIARGVFTSVKDLARKLMRYIRNYNKTATPIRWIYKNVRRRIVPNAI